MWNTFRTCGRDDQQGGFAAAYLAKNFQDKNIAIINDKTTYGKGLADEVKQALNAAGVKEKLYESYNRATKTSPRSSPSSSSTASISSMTVATIRRPA